VTAVATPTAAAVAELDRGRAGRDTPRVMSQENVDIVRHFFEALRRSIGAWERSRSFADAVKTGDIPPETTEVLRYLSPDMAWRPIFSSETYRGFIEVARGWDELLEASADYGLELLDATSLDADRVFVTFGPTLEGRFSHIHVNAEVFAVVSLRDRLIARWDEFTDRSEALAAAGVGT
jgi:ketosteroid isomerase-like protein